MSDTTAQEMLHDEIRDWLRRLGHHVGELTPLAGDVSHRRYLRVVLDSRDTAVVAVYPAALREACQRFLRSTELLHGVGVRVPRILADACGSGLTLLEDVGSETLFDGRRRPAVADNLDRYFRRAVEDIARIQAIPARESGLIDLNPPLDHELLSRELAQTWSAVLEPHGVVEDVGFAHHLEEVLQEICRRLAAEPVVPCHRDFMCRNLVPTAAPPELIVLDHQDLRLGPPCYDLASLLNDSLFPTPDLEKELLSENLGDEASARVSYHRAAAQRTLKAIGTYETFAQRGDARHRPLIPQTLSRALRHLDQLPEAADLRPQLEKRVAGLIIC